MESLTALGLASNILQFIEFSSNLVRGAAKVYHSTSGLPAELEDVVVITDSLNSYMGRLSPPALSPSASLDDKALMALVSNCQETCRDLKELVENIKGKDPGSRRDSFRVAWRSLRSKGRLEELEKRLDRYRSQILSHLIYILREENQGRQAWFESQQSTDKVYIMEMRQDIREIREKVLALVQHNSHDSQASSAYDASIYHGNTLRDIRVALSDISARMRTATAESQVLDLLWFPEIRLRVGSIDEAHRGTYRWLLYDSRDAPEHVSDIQSSSSSPSTSLIHRDTVTNEQGSHKEAEAELPNSIDEDSDRHTTTTTTSTTSSYKERHQRQSWREKFHDWLQNSSESFFISGKPGSGKSTLLKYVSQDPLTRQMLEAWARNDAKDIIVVRFFFWNSGASEQRTTQGLCRTVLWEVLQSRPDLTQQLFPVLWRKACNGSLHKSDLNHSAIQTAFHILISQENLLSKHKVCFFIDGLDECEEDHWNLTKKLKSWCSAPGVKLCVSSRPYNEFIKAFAPPNESWLRLHDLTRMDILRVVHDQFASDERFVEARHLSEDSEEYDKLTNSIVFKADGVFVWVILVIRSLLSGIGNRCSVSQLRRRLDAVPTELNSMFHYMMGEIDQIERTAAARAFLVLKTLRTDIGSLVYLHSVLDDLEDEPDCQRDLLDGRLDLPRGSQNETSKCISMAHRLSGRCRGLVQVTYTGRNFPHCHLVQFVHRTVSEFMSEERIVQELQTYSGDFCPFRGIALGLISMAKRVPEECWQSPCQNYRSSNAFGDTEYLEDKYELLSSPTMVMYSLLSLAGTAENAHVLPFTAEIEAMTAMLVCLEAPTETECEGGIGMGTGHGLFDWTFGSRITDAIDHTVLCLAASTGAFEYVKARLARQSPDSQLEGLLSIASWVGWNAGYEQLENATGFIQLLFQRMLSPNTLLMDEIFSMQIQDRVNSIQDFPGPQYLPSATWTPWTLLLMRVAEQWILRNRMLHTAWKELLQLYLNQGADQSVCFIGYKLPDRRENPPWNDDGSNLLLQRDEDEIINDSKGPFYATLPTMFQTWGFDVILPLRAWMSRGISSIQPLLGSWLNALKPDEGQILEIRSTGIQRWNFLVLKVVPYQRMKETKILDLNRALRDVLRATRHQ